MTNIAVHLVVDDPEDAAAWYRRALGAEVTDRLSVPDADASFDQAVGAGATVFEAVHDAFWGDRTGQVVDPSGHRWAFDQHVRDVPRTEVAQQAARLFAGPAAS